MATRTPIRGHAPAVPWTRRQRQVLGLLVESKTNAQIADVLGITLDGAKWHVSEVITKLGVDTREEAADYWRRENGLGARISRWARAAVPASVPLRWAALGATGFTAVAAAAVLVVLASQGGDADAPGAASSETPTAATPSPTVTGTASPTATVSPTVEPEIEWNGLEVTTLQQGPGAGLSEGAVYYVEAGCSQCDGPPLGIDRVHVDAAGNRHVERVFERPDPENEYITSVAVSEDGAAIVVGVCQQLGYCGGVGEADPNARTTIFGSADGGITWSELADLEGGAWVQMAEPLPPGQGVLAVVEPSYQDDAGERAAEYLSVSPFGVEPYTGGAQADTPLFISNHRVLLTWQEQPEAGLYRLAGASQPDLVPEIPDGARVIAVHTRPQGGGWVVVWRLDEPGEGLPAGTYTGVMPDRSGPFSAVMRWPEGFGFFRWTGTWAGERALMNVFHDSRLRPALVDLDTGTIEPLDEYFDERTATGDRSVVLAASGGPHVRVSGTGDDCLNVRDGPSLTENAALGCFADGVLLLDRNETRIEDGVTWVGLMTPDRQPGWASAEFLDTAGRDMSERPAAHPAGTRTGNPDIDPVIEAIESGDPGQVLGVTAFLEIACASEPEGLGGPPACEEGEPDGTIIETIPGAACHGYYTRRAAFEASPRSGAENAQLWAVAEVPAAQGAADWPQGDYALVYTVAAPSGSFGRVVYVEDGRMVNRWDGCGTTPQGALERFTGEGGAVILEPVR